MSRLLIVDDEESLLLTLEMLFTREGFTVQTARGGQEALQILKAGNLPDLMISDIKMPDLNGMEVLRAAKKMAPYLPVVLISAQANMQDAIAACNEGAYHFLEKPFKNQKLIQICNEALDKGQADKQYSKRRRELSSSGMQQQDPIGKADEFICALRKAEKAAKSQSTILIQGESGTGKELIAKYIFRHSERHKGTFIPVNCGALTETLLESELFGHVKGSFTGAITTKEGLFKAASGGTIFLDEIGETSLSFQVKLLRVLQEKTITPVGSTDQESVDVRVIAASNRDLESEVEALRFRSDLFYRLNVIPILLPALRDRPEDIPLLIDFILARKDAKTSHHTRFNPAAIKCLMEYRWPGNVRELENVIEQLEVVGPTSKITECDLPEKIRTRAPENFISEKPKATPTLEAVETAYITWVMDQVQGSKKEASKILGIDPSTLYRKLTR